MFRLLALALLLSPFARADVLDDLDRALKGNGVAGWVHGSASDLGQYVFTWRNPSDFFEHLEFPMVAANSAAAAALAGLSRHDEILVKGAFAASPAPVRHIEVDSITLIRKFTGNPAGVPPYARQAQLPRELEGKTELLGKVHAVVDGGKILVVEYKDAVVPVYVADPALSKDLFRNDKIRLTYRLRKTPNRPTHVTLVAVEVTDRMTDSHGKRGSIEGTLVMFPKSPQIKFNVFALQVVDAEGVSREWTLVNFDDFEAFTAIRLKLQKLWDSEPSGVVNGRNKFLNPKIRMRATGTFNIIDPNQANPQVLLSSEADLVRLP